MSKFAQYFVAGIVASLVATLSVLWVFAKPTDTIITDCSEAGLEAALAIGGVLRFDCGPATITLTSQKNITGTVTIDGNDQIVLNGDNATRLFSVTPSGRLTLNRIELSAGYAEDWGGAIFSEGVLTLNHVTIRDSRVGDGLAGSGGAIYSYAGLVVLNSSRLLDNFAAGDGGGLTAADGKAGPGSFTLINSLVQGNRAGLHSGGLNINSPTVILNSTIRNNEVLTRTDYSASGVGGGLSVFVNTLTVQQSVIEDNRAYGGGAGMVIWNPARVRIEDSHISGNQTTAPMGVVATGGGIENRGKLTLARVAIRDNRAGLGAGVFHFAEDSRSELVVFQSTFGQNLANEEGGALYVQRGRALLVNVTISDNTAIVAGGGLYLNEPEGQSTLQNITLWGNRAPVAANVYTLLGATQTTIQNSIVANPLGGGNNCEDDANLGSGGRSIFSDDSCLIAAAAGDQIGVDPLLGPLTQNGGATATHLPDANSPAVDVVVDECPRFDQRGYIRPVGENCDAGAVERGAEAEPPPPAFETATPTATPPPTPLPTATITPTVLPALELLPPLAPAALPTGAHVTIQVSPAQSPAGQPIMISGQGAPGSDRVRLAVVIDRQTIGIEDVAVGEDGTYSAQIPVGDTFEPGTVQLCAMALGIDDAEIGCTDFAIEPPPFGSVQGVLPFTDEELGAAQRNAEFRLMNAAGATLYVTPILPSGRFAIPDVRPGLYLYAVSGLLPEPVAGGLVEVKPIEPSVIDVAVRDICDTGSITKPTSAVSAHPSRAEFVRTYSGHGMFRNYVDERRPFGLYVTGVRNDVTFTALPQSTGPVQKVVFEFVGLSSQTIERFEDNSPPFVVTFDVGRLPVSQFGKHPSLVVTPVVNGVEQCPSGYDIEVMADPMVDDYLQPAPYSYTAWDQSAHVYRFQGRIPYIDGALPAFHDLGEIPLLGHLYSEFNTGILVNGYFNLEGKARLYLLQAFADAVVLGLPVLPKDDGGENITPPGLDSVEFSIRNPREIAIPFGRPEPIKLFQDEYMPIPATKVLIFTYFGIVNAYINGQVVFGVGIYLDGEVRPLEPSMETTLTGTGSLAAELGISADILVGLVEGGLGLGGAICVNLPLTVLLAEEPDVYFESPTLGGRFYVVAWASAFWGLYKTRTTKTLTNFGAGCPGSMLQASDGELLVPALFPSPAVAAAPDGRLLAASVENTASEGETPQVQILVRFQEPGSEEWSEAQPVSNPAHSAKSPTVAFVGPNAIPMVAWTENVLTAQEAGALGEDANAHLRHQEIYYALWLDGSWEEPIALTDDLLGEGLAEAAGSPTGAVLAWTRDLDGDASTRTDQRIAVSHFDLETRQFGAHHLLSGAGGGLNADVSVAYDLNGETPVAYLAWVHDQDGKLETPDDRRLIAAYSDGFEWVLLNPQPLPPRVDSPAITVGTRGVQVAFLVREQAPDGSTGMMGTNGALWTAQRVDGQWIATPVLDASGATVYAEQPVLDHIGDETLLVFRQFGREHDTSSLGQISMSNIQATAPPSPPLYVTDTPEQKWLPALVINPISRQAVILNATLALSSNSAASVAAQRPIGASQTVAAADSMRISADPAAVELHAIHSGADPAVDPLVVEVTASAPSSTTVVIATVRNVGRGVASDLTVSLYHGASATGVLLDTKPVPDTLPLNQTHVISFEVATPLGQYPLYVQVSTSAENLVTANDSAAITLGLLSTPARVAIQKSEKYSPGIDLLWSGNVREYVSGYRILRSGLAEGPWELVGESASPAFTDTLVTPGQTYCYAIQAFNANTISNQGPAFCTLLPLHALHLPTVQR